MPKFKKLHTHAFVLIATLLSCTSNSQSPAISQESVKATDTATTAHAQPITRAGHIPCPVGFQRVESDSNDFAHYLRNMSIKEDNTVYLYNGTPKYNQAAQYAVLDIDVGKRDLQQCADAVMRLRAEYLFSTRQFDRIAFRFTSGHPCVYTKYRDGYRPKVSGSQVTWSRTAQKDTSHACFRRYMDLVFSYCGTQSMDKEVSVVPISDIKPGDVFHQTGNPYGHAVTVMDVAKDSSGEVIFMLSQSYMPAQNIHILKNPNAPKLDPWYSWKDGESLVTPEWTFPPHSLKRWK